MAGPNETPAANPAAAGGAVTAPAPAPDAPEIKDVTVEGYTFKVDLNLVDDVENVDLIDKIENGANLKAIVVFLQRLLGEQGYKDLQAYFVKKDGKFKMSKLGDIYTAIFEQFNPKG